jgi:DNA-binding transcriptional regulator YhcF (GntR family)
MEYQTEQTDADQINLEPEVRVGHAVYLQVLNNGVMTEHGALLKDGLNMNQIAKQAEVSMNYGIKATTNLRKQGFVRNRKEDGRLLVKVDELEAWLLENGAVID